MHYLTDYSCTGPGFCYHQRCSHHALLLDHLGWLPEFEAENAPAPAPMPTIQCANCSGGGVVYVRDCERAGWPHPECPVCKGSGELPAPIITTHFDVPALVAAEPIAA